MADLLKIGLPLTRQNIGPKIFLRRLKKSITEQKLAKLYHFYNPLHQIAIYNTTAKNIYQKPYVLRIDGIHFDKMETYQNNKELNNKIFDSIKKADGIIFQSEFNKLFLEKILGKTTIKNIVINNGAEIIGNSKNLIDRKYKKSEKKTIICSANWRKHKRLLDIVKVINKLNSIKNEYELIIIGQNASNFISSSTKSIKIVGNVDPSELNYYYQISDLYIHLAWIDHCPNTLIEAISNGLPVIVSNQGGAKEIVEMTNSGIISKCDKNIVVGEFVDLYNPPEPDINVIVNDVLDVFNNYNYYKNNMKLDAINIDLVARKYVSFLENVYNDLRLAK
jgi:glycosyltransferase involved in cell wall biosynthesis